MLVAVFGDVAHAHGAALADGRMSDILSAQGNTAGHQRFQPGEAVDQLRLAVAVNPGNADDLAPPHLEGHVLHSVVLMDLGGHGHVLHIQHHISGMGGLLFHMEVHAAAHHHGRQLLRGGVSGIADVLALAKHGAAIRHRHDLRQLVGDKEDGFALRRQILHDLHQLVDLLRGQHGGRFVENQDLIVPVQHFQNLSALLHTHGDVLDQCVRIHVQAVLFAEGQHLLPRFFFL